MTNAFEDRYFEEINDMHVGYNNVSIQYILAYLYNLFGKLSTLEQEEVEKIFNELYNPTTPFSTFIRKIEEAIDLAAVVRCYYIPQKIVAKAFNCIIKV